MASRWISRERISESRLRLMGDIALAMVSGDTVLVTQRIDGTGTKRCELHGRFVLDDRQVEMFEEMIRAAE